MLVIPSWALFGFIASFAMVTNMMFQERFKINGYTLVFWNKVFITAFIAPFAFKVGLPDNPWFYASMIVQSIIYCYSDVNFANSVAKIGSGLVSRITPIGVIFSFFLWLAISPEQFYSYLQHPLVSLGILTAILLATISASFLKRCPVSRESIKMVWPCILATSIGPTLTKITLDQTTLAQATFSYIFIQGIIMSSFWFVYFLIKKPVSSEIFFKPSNIKAGILVGIFSCIVMLFKTRAMVLTDNPAYISIIMYTNAIWIILIYKMIGRKEDANIWAGLGVVFSAILLIFFKSIPV
jgi:hypothetical protein